MCAQILRTCSVRLSGSVVSPSRATAISRVWNWSVATFGPACVCSRRWKWWCHQTGRSICPTAAWTTDALWCNWTRWWWMLISESLLHPWWNQLEVIFWILSMIDHHNVFRQICLVCDDFLQSPLAQTNPEDDSDDFIRFLQITKQNLKLRPVFDPLSFDFGDLNLHGILIMLKRTRWTQKNSYK